MFLKYFTAAVLLIYKDALQNKKNIVENQKIITLTIQDR